jgi:hypothetical protein
LPYSARYRETAFAVEIERRVPWSITSDSGKGTAIFKPNEKAYEERSVAKSPT